MNERPSKCGHLAAARPDLARRRFLGGVGSMALLAGASVLTTPFARAAATASYAGGSVGLELDGAFAGYIRSATGGEPVFEVSAVPTGAPAADKSVASRHSMPLELGTAGSMSASFYSWVGAFSAGEAAMHSGALVQFDLNRNPVRRLVFNDASIVAVAMPPLDGSSTDRLTLNVTILPQSSSMDLSAKGPVAPSIQDKNVMANAFRLQIRDFENFAAFVAQLDLFLGIAVFHDLIVQRHHIEGNRHRPFRRRRKINRPSVTRQRRAVRTC